jgi:hypothetical protein
VCHFTFQVIFRYNIHLNKFLTAIIKRVLLFAPEILPRYVHSFMTVEIRAYLCNLAPAFPQFRIHSIYIINITVTTALPSADILSWFYSYIYTMRSHHECIIYVLNSLWFYLLLLVYDCFFFLYTLYCYIFRAISLFARHFWCRFVLIYLFLFFSFIFLPRISLNFSYSRLTGLINRGLPRLVRILYSLFFIIYLDIVSHYYVCSRFIFFFF